MSLDNKVTQVPYQVHNISEIEVPKCCLCETGMEVQTHYHTPVFSENKMSYMMLCEKDYKKLMRRIKYRWFYNIINSIKRLILWVKISMKKAQ